MGLYLPGLLYVIRRTLTAQIWGRPWWSNVKRIGRKGSSHTL